MLLLFSGLASALGLPTIPKTVDILDTTKYFPVGPERNPTAATIDVRPHQSYGTCACDTSNRCEINCCCDQDCSEAVRSGFTICLPETEPDTDRYVNDWALHNCSDPDTFDAGNTIVDWFMRTMLCLHRNNNPSFGDFYEFTELNGGPGPISDSSIPVVDGQFSFLGVFDDRPRPASRLVPGDRINFTETSTGQFLFIWPNGSCGTSFELQYLIPIEGECIVEADLTNVYSVATVAYGPSGDESSPWVSSVSPATPEPAVTAGPCNVSILWEADPAGSQTVLRRRGYQFGELIETEDGFLRIPVPGATGFCDTTEGGFVAFGGNVNVACANASWTINLSETFDQIPNPDPWEVGYSTARLRPVPFQVGYDNSELIPVSVLSELPSNVTFYTHLDAVIQELLVFYRLAGDRTSPEKVINNVDFRTHVVPRVTVYSNTMPDDLKANVKLQTIISFVEIPSDVTLSESEPSHTAEQAWLPF
jgi:hypothetical protein